MRSSIRLSALLFVGLVCVMVAGTPSFADTPPADGKMLTFKSPTDVDNLEHLPGVVLVDLYAFW